MIEIHSNAAKNFNEKAELLLQDITEYVEESPTSGRQQFSPNLYPAANLGNIGANNNLSVTKVDPFGNILERYFTYNNTRLGLFGEGYKRFEKLVKGIQKAPSFRNAVSVKMLSRVVFEWLESRYIHKTDQPMTDYILAQCETAITPREIWLPIANLAVQSDFTIGEVHIRAITGNRIDTWLSSITEQQRAENTELNAYTQRMREQLQGTAAAVINVVAEPERAFELAIAEGERAVSLLRIFAPENLIPGVSSYCVLRGKKNLPSVMELVVTEGKLRTIRNALVHSRFKFWTLDAQMIADITDIGLTYINEILMNPQQSNFEITILDTLLLYSRNTIEEDVADRLVYILVALESLLLKNTNESIQQNLAERFAIFLGKTVDERKEMIRVIKETYKLRSSFIHHGKEMKEQDYEILSSFMNYTWQFFMQLLKNHDRFIAKEDFIDSIETFKLS